jgi:hypothetical protein
MRPVQFFVQPKAERLIRRGCDYFIVATGTDGRRIEIRLAAVFRMEGVS